MFPTKTDFEGGFDIFGAMRSYLKCNREQWKRIRSQGAWNKDLRDEDRPPVTINLRNDTEVSEKVVLAILIHMPPFNMPNIFLSVSVTCSI